MKPLAIPCFRALVPLALVLAGGVRTLADEKPSVRSASFDKEFLIKPSEVKRQFLRPEGPRLLAFKNHSGSFDQWRDRCKAKLTELLNVKVLPAGAVRELRQTIHEGVQIEALVME